MPVLRLKPRLQRPPGTVQSEPDGGFGPGNRGEGARPNMLTSTGVPGGDQLSKPTHSSMEVDDANSEVEIPLCSAHTRYVRPRAALNSNLEWR